MIREERFLISRRPYAVDLESLRVAPGHPVSVRVDIDAVWFRRRRGVLVAVIGTLWDYQSKHGVPADVHEALARHTDGRYGGSWIARWDGESYVSEHPQSPEAMAAHLAVLRTSSNTSNPRGTTMSTRSVVGTVDLATGEFKGRYVHSDGYPTARGPVLTEILARFDGGLAQMLKVITEDHFGWSYLDVHYAQNTLGPARADLVSNVGLAYRNHVEQEDYWYTGKLNGGDDVEEWGYFFTSTDPSTAELIVTTDGARVVAKLPVTMLHRISPAGWDHIEMNANGDELSFEQLALPAAEEVIDAELVEG